ncbi:hypothetical protein L208DRAFT_1389717 [Tricholoma matsutake]|nr:hypothetical protein L208DRAFT_1389717 [Tricholoma matsutake 945]
MERKETVLSASTEQQLDEITGRLLQQRDACMEWTSHSTEREDEKDMRRLEKKARCGDLYGQMEKLRMDGESLRKTVDILSAQAVGAGLIQSVVASAMQLIQNTYIMTR